MRGVASEKNASDAMSGGTALMHVVRGVERKFISLVTRQDVSDDTRRSAP